jgi:hypothetical protein
MLREENKVQVFENRMPKRIFEPKRNEVTGGWGKLHTEDLHNLYSSPNIIKMIKAKGMRGTGHTAHMKGMRNKIKVTTRKTYAWMGG